MNEGEQLREPLAAFLRRQVDENVSIGELRPLAGGASRQSWALEATLPEGEATLVLRMDAPTTMNPEALSRSEEFRLLQVAYEAGVRCPRPYYLCPDPSVLGAPFFLMEYVSGESIGPRVVRRPELAEARQRLPRQMARQLARIHGIGAGDLDFLPRPEQETSPARHLVATLRRRLQELGVHSPGLAAGLRWLELNPPSPGVRCLLHGDFRVGNLIVDEDGLAAVIDWEFAHVGDPLEDVAWPLVRDWRFGNDHLRLGGIAEAGAYLALYEQETGRELNRSAVTYWEIMGNMKWAITCLVQAQRHLSGEDPSVELASLGRRSAEMEWELLSLISQA